METRYRYIEEDYRKLSYIDNNNNNNNNNDNNSVLDSVKNKIATWQLIRTQTYIHTYIHKLTVCVCVIQVTIGCFYLNYITSSELYVFLWLFSVMVCMCVCVCVIIIIIILSTSIW